MKINDLLNIEDEFVIKTKIHFASGGKDNKEPLYAFYRNEFKEWQENQANRNFQRDYIISLIWIGKDEWLFAGVYRRVGVEEIDGKFIYKTELLDIYTELIGRLIVGYKKEFRQSYPYFETCIDDLEMVEILRENHTIDPFPGYENVQIKFDLLKTIIAKEESSWKTALSNLKGVYLISDTLTGKLYVGSAYGEDAFWNRWADYSKDGHGGNKDLKRVISEKGIEYAANFQYSILETRSKNVEDNEIIKRESYWKDLLLSREFGYNMN